MDKHIRIVIACDSFKGSLSSKDIFDIFKVISADFCDCISITGITIADGGDGTLDALTQNGGYTVRKVLCKNPLFTDITARYAINDRGQALIEMAEASGLTLIPYRDGNAQITTTYGTGQLIMDAIKNGATDIYVCVGGSATNDGGIGALSALGYKFRDKNGEELLPIGNNLINIKNVDTSGAIDISKIKFTIVADVNNPLLGKRGATMVYGAQKGAVGKIAEDLEIGMENYADIVYKTTGVKLHDLKSAGAAGGLSGGLVAFLGATIKSGVDTVLSLINFDKLLNEADVIITGEGRLDLQSFNGKAICGITKAATKRNIPLYAIAGCITLDDDKLKELGIRRAVTLKQYAESFEDSIKNARKYAEFAAKELLDLIIKDF